MKGESNDRIGKKPKKKKKNRKKQKQTKKIRKIKQTESMREKCSEKEMIVRVAEPTIRKQLQHQQKVIASINHVIHEKIYR